MFGSGHGVMKTTYKVQSEVKKFPGKFHPQLAHDVRPAWIFKQQRQGDLTGKDDEKHYLR